MKKNTLFLLLIIGSGLLTGCEKNQPTQLSITDIHKKYAQATALHGTVRSDTGFMSQGTITVSNLQNEVIATTSLQNSKNYRVEIAANTALPLILTFQPENSTAKTDALITIVAHPSISKYDISPLTTMIAKRAIALGGYSDANLRQAAESTVAAPDRDKTTAGFRGDPTQHYGGWH